MTERAIGDPADKVQGLDQFANHRTGYGDLDAKTQRILSAARRGHSLAAGEGALLVYHFEALLEATAKKGYEDLATERADRGKYSWD